MTKKTTPAFWPSLPTGRFDIDRVHDLLVDWALLSEWKLTDDEKKSLFKNSVLHPLECAIVLYLSAYIARSGTGFCSDILQRIENLEIGFESRLFERGYPREMAQCLYLCYELDEPWLMSRDDAEACAEELIKRIKDIALYEVDHSVELEKVALSATGEAIKYKELSDRFRKGGVVGRRSDLKKYVEAVMLAQDLSQQARPLWRRLVEATRINEQEGTCPLRVDEDGRRLFEEKNGKEYGFDRFQKHLVEIRKNKI